MMLIRIGILTVSDRTARGETEDASGPLLQQMAQERLGGRGCRQRRGAR